MEDIPGTFQMAPKPLTSFHHHVVTGKERKYKQNEKENRRYEFQAIGQTSDRRVPKIYFLFRHTFASLILNECVENKKRFGNTWRNGQKL